MAKNGNHHSSKNKSKDTLKSRLKAKYKKKFERKLKAETDYLREQMKQPVQYIIQESQVDSKEKKWIKEIDRQFSSLLNKFFLFPQRTDEMDELPDAVDENVKISHTDFFDRDISLKNRQEILHGYVDKHLELIRQYNKFVEVKKRYSKNQHECFSELFQGYTGTINDIGNVYLENILEIDRCASDYLKKIARKARSRQKTEVISGKKNDGADDKSSIKSVNKAKASDISLVKDEQNSGNTERTMKKSKLEAARKMELLRFIKKEIPSIKSYFMKEKKCFHFDMPVKLETEDDIKAVRDWLNDPEKIACHSFLPLISNEIVSRQKRKIEEFRFYEKTLQETANPQVQELCHETIAKFEKNGPVKKRPIRMCSNRDTLVFAHYSRMLGELYEKYIRDLGFSECVVAYRSTPPVEINGVKCSFSTIPAVYDVVQYVREHNNKCVALAFDMSSFFDCIDHRNLKDEWKKVLGVDELPRDHYNIFKALTRYSFVEHNEIKEYVKYIEAEENGASADDGGTASEKADAGNIKDEQLFSGRERVSLRKYFTSISDFRKFRKWYSQNEQYADYKSFHKNPGMADKDAPYGIPQGLSISAVLSNIYMIPFDEAISAYAREKGYLYRRYCDDIMLVGDIDHDDIMKVYEFINREIWKRGHKLKLHPFIQDFYNPYSKSQIYDFSSPDIKKLPMQYLGFYFDGSEIRIREGSIAGFYRNMDKAVTAGYLRTFERIKRRILRDHSTAYLAENQLAKVKIECVKYYGDDRIAFNGDSLPKKFRVKARKRMIRRCADKCESIRNKYREESQLKKLTGRFVLSDIDKKTGKVKYRSAFLPNVKKLHRMYSFRSSRNFISYAMNAARIFGGEDENNIIRRQMRSHSHHLHQKIDDAYIKTCFRLKKMVNEVIAKNQRK